jgi:hypothetical protein
MSIGRNLKRLRDSWPVVLVALIVLFVGATLYAIAGLRWVRNHSGELPWYPKVMEFFGPSPAGTLMQAIGLVLLAWAVFRPEKQPVSSWMSDSLNDSLRGVVAADSNILEVELRRWADQRGAMAGVEEETAQQFKTTLAPKIKSMAKRWKLCRIRPAGVSLRGRGTPEKARTIAQAFAKARERAQQMDEE